jgi:hypothetical protein
MTFLIIPIAAWCKLGTEITWTDRRSKQDWQTRYAAVFRIASPQRQ